MACTSYTLTGIDNYCKQPSLAGIKEVYIALYDDVSATTVDSGTSQITISMASGKTFQTYTLLRNTGGLTSTLQVSDNRSSYFTNECTLQFMKQETQKRLEIQALMMSSTAVIVRDGNDKYWYLTKDYPCECTAGSAQTGTAASDSNHYELTLSSDSAELPYEVPASNIEQIVA